MADAFTSYQVDNDRRFRNALQMASEFSQDFRVPFGLILRDFYRSEQAIFKLKGPGQYPPFKNSIQASTLGGKGNTANGRRRTEYTVEMSPYQKWKVKHFPATGPSGYPLLFRTGKLAASLLGPNNDGSISFIGKLSLIFGTSVAYGIYHQSDGARTKLPLRKFIFIGPEASRFATSDQMGRLERWLGYVHDHIGRSLAKAGLSK